jgi:hypothetical protein
MPKVETAFGLWHAGRRACVVRERNRYFFFFLAWATPALGAQRT